jgi:peptidoglycan/xylan/chitin deacetylase (PgdA/CDA1 family)
MKCTFNLYSRILHDPKRAICLETLKDIYAGHEIASHAYSHPHLEKMPLKLQYDEVIKDREAIEPVWGEIIRGFAYPFGTFSDDTKLALKTAGIVYARTVNSAINSFAPPNDFLEWNPTTHHNESADAIRRFIYNVEKAPWRAGGLLYIWGHSYEFDKNDNWEHIENICKKLAFSDEIWYATNIEIYDYVEAYKRLRYSANGRKVYNPTLYTIWLDVDSKLYTINPGETIRIDG